MRFLVGGLALGGVLLGPVAPVGAEGLRPTPPLRGPAPLLLNMLALPVERPGASFRESLREVPTARGGVEGEMGPDGSARLGNPALYATIKNPCPEGTLHTRVALPGRNRR